MRTIKKYTRAFVMLMLVIILLENCTVYKSKPTTIQQVSEASIKTKIKTHYGVIFKFKYIEFENGNYYGVRKFKGKLEKIILEEEYIKSVHGKNNTLSTVANIVLPTLIVLGILVIIQPGQVIKPGAKFEIF